MTKLAVIVMLAAGLTACSRKKTEEGREPAQSVAQGPMVGGAASPPAPTPAPATPGAAEATAPGAMAGSAAPASPPAMGCAQPNPLTCGAEQADGCSAGLTTVHTCVAKDAKAGPPCAQPGSACPAGQVDACLHEPPQSINHVCVAVAKPTP